VTQKLFNGGKRPFGFDVIEEGDTKRLEPKASEQAALARGKALRKSGKSYRYIAEVWASEFNIEKVDAKSIQRMLARE
jgi:hypothetical protein